MTAVIGQVLPLALGIAISPVPIIAAILMLLSPKARRTGLGFLVGWVGGIVVVLTAFTLLASVVTPADPNDSRPVVGLIQLLLGALLVAMAVKQWRGRPGPGDEPALPTWMTAIDQMTAGKAGGLGFLLAAVNPKNLLMGIGAGVTIGSAGLGPGAVVVVETVFTVIAASSVAVPVIGYLAATDAMSSPLESLRVWLVHNNATIMAALLLVIGVVLIGKGIGSF